MDLYGLEPLIHRIVWPIVGVTLGAAVALKFFRRRDSLFKMAALNPDYGLAKQLLFWMAVLIPVIYFVEFGSIAWTDYKPSLDKEGFDKFLEISKLPILLLSLSIPLTALVAKLHSTAQTARQIEKNKHELFYLHRKEFTAYYQQIGITKYWAGFTATFSINPRIHGRLFKGEVSEGTPKLRVDVVDRLIGQLNSARKLLVETLTESDVYAASSSYIQFSRLVLKLTHFFNIRDVEEVLEATGVKVPGATDLYLPGTNPRRVADVYLVLENYLIAAVEFAGYEEGRRLMLYDKGEFKRILAANIDERIITNVTSAILSGAVVEQMGT